MDKRIIDYLEDLALSEIEAKLYATLLTSGAMTVRELARKAGVVRTSAYPYIDMLLEKELIIKIVKGSRTQVTINAPVESLQRLIEQKTQSLESIKEDFPTITKMIHPSLLQGDAIGEAEIRYYKGKLGVKKIYEEALKGSELRLYANLSELASLLPNEIHLFDKAFTQNPKLKVLELIADKPDTIKHFNLTSRNGRYLHKFIPMHVGLESTGILIFENKVAILNVNEEMSGIVLHNRDYYANSKKLFDFMWNTLPEVNQE